MRFEISKVMRQDRVMDLVYGNCDCPGDLLGRHFVRNGQVIAAFHPDAIFMELIDDTGRVYPMDMVERQPVFAVFLQDRRAFPYRIRMSFPDGNTFITRDPYIFDGQIRPEESKLFSEGIWKEAAEKLGSHPDTVAGMEGTRFAVWAPGARRVSIVGDFNYWNGMLYPMQRVAGTDFFELFLPDVHPGQLYKYEIKNRQGEVYQKRDPFALMNEKKENGASIILNMGLFRWDDRRWIASRTSRGLSGRPLSICEIYFPEIMYPEEKVRETVLAMGSTHILLKNRPEGAAVLSEELSDVLEKEDLQTNQKGIFEPAYSMSAPDRLRSFISRCHKNHIAVLMEITPEYLEKGASSLRETAGIKADVPRLLENVPDGGAFSYFFDYGKEMFNYILSCLAFWIRAYHVDGFVMDGFRRRILEICRQAESLGLLPGSQEMDALLEKGYAFVGNLRESIREMDSSVLVAGERITADSLLEDRSGWPGEYFSYPDFDLYWDDETLSGLDTFMRTAPEKQAGSVSLLTMPVMRAGRHDKLIRINKEWEGGSSEDRSIAMTTTLAYAFLMGMPGKKVWSLNPNENSLSRRFAQDLFSLYREMPALHDSFGAGGRFEWINAQDGVTGIISFIRTAVHGRDSLLFVCNFGTKDQTGYRVGVPKRGLYQPVLSNSGPEYGGNEGLVSEACEAESVPQDLREYSIQISLPAKTVVIYRFD